MQAQVSYKVLLIGDSCIDRYVYGEVKRLNPEAPVPVLNYKRTETKKGMCLNVEANLKSFGIDVTTITHPEKIIKTRYIDEKSNQQLLRVDEEIEVSSFESSLNTKEYDALIISDYNKGFLDNKKLFNIVKNIKCPTFIDSKKINLSFETNSQECFIKINELEYKNLEQIPDNIIVTMGENGARYKEKIYHTHKVETRDIVGAGDTFLAALTFGYLRYRMIEKAIQFANSCAGIAVSNPGTYVLTKRDVKMVIDLLD